MAHSLLALVELSTVRPTSDTSCTRQLPAAAEATTIGPRLPRRDSCSTPVVSHHFDGLLRVQAPGILQPEPDRVRHVLWSPHCTPPKLAWADSSDSITPRDAFRTLQRFPLVGSRRRVTTRRCHLAVIGTRLPDRHPRPL